MQFKPNSQNNMSDLTSLVKDYQKLLKKEHLYNGYIDGEAGPLTAIAALSYHCPESGYYPKWMRFAIGELGVSELYGKRHNPRITHYHSFTGLAAQEDETAWCASFINCCLIEGAGIAGNNNASAAKFEKYGKDCPVTKYGSILTVPTNTGSLRHVFFNAGSYKDLILGLGGNQSNRVSILLRDAGDIAKSRYPII